jgi:hypothetical protein
LGGAQSDGDGRLEFVKLVPDTLVVEVVEFETSDPALRGEMTITITLSEAGWMLSLEKLASLVQAGYR